MRRAFGTRTLVACCFPLCALTAAAAGAQDVPKRKPGLWQQTVTTSVSGAAPQSISICTDEKIDSLMADRAGASQKCTQQSARQQGNSFVIEAVCKDANTTIRTRGTFSGDFASRYSGELRSTFEPPLHGMKEMTQKIDARWVGPCKPGQKPGDVVLEGMGGMNMQELMDGDPQKMNELMQKMQQMQQPPR